jgi:sugar phosphate isomerase/epimerase
MVSEERTIADVANVNIPCKVFGDPMNPISRRDFLARSGAIAACATIPSLLQAQASETYLFPAGIQLYAVRDPLASDAPGTLKALHSIGYREVETAGFGKYTAHEFRRLCDDAGLQVPSAHLPFQNATDVPALLAQANELGAQFAVSSFLYDLFGPGNPLPTKPIDQLPPTPPIGLDGFKKMAAHMNDLGTQAKAAGLQYAYHNHNFEFERLPDGRFGYDVLLAETDHELVKFEVDCGWLIIGGADPTQYFTRYPGRYRMLHVKDFKTRILSANLFGPNRPTGVELGRGFIDYRPIIVAAKKAGLLHAFAEQEAPYTRSQLASAQVSYDYLRSVEKIG